MKFRIRTLAFKALSVVFLLGAVVLARVPETFALGETMNDYAKVPAFLESGIPPNLLLVIDNSASMYDQAYVNPENNNYCFVQDRVDYDGDGEYTSVNEDVDLDGVLDTEDTNGDGTLNTEDLNGNNRLDDEDKWVEYQQDVGWADYTYFINWLNNGQLDDEDLDNDGYITTEDINDNGVLDSEDYFYKDDPVYGATWY
ncbi:MAG: hypothetical protein P1P81_07470, partial [Desulfobulbales bacterium]|nr:hypothetical protein [Desulfobulbales bacterium]